MLLTQLCSAALLGLAGGELQPIAATPLAGDFAVRAQVLHLGDGTAVENGIVVVSDGKIRAAGSMDVPTGMTVIEHAGHVSPGMISPWAPNLLPGTERNETTRPFLEDLHLVHAFDGSLEAVEDALSAGITTVQLLGSTRNVVAGRTAAVKTAGHGAGPNVLDRDLALMVVINSSSANNGRYPTSYSGISTELTQRLAVGEGAWGEVKSGRRPLLIAVTDRHDILRATSLFAGSGATGALAGATLAGEVLDAVAASGMQVVVPPYGPGVTSRAIESLTAIANSDVPFAFGLGFPSTFRYAAAVALRDGADETSMRRAFHHDAAVILGLEDRIGRLAPGFDADLVLWSGDPLDLTSSPQAVYVDGVLEFEASVANAR